jgi:hypothetical protein
MPVMVEPVTDGGGIYTCANCGAMQGEKNMVYSSIFHGMLCSACKPKDSTDIPIRVSAEAHRWLMKNRGSGSVKKLVDKLIEKYQEARAKEGDTT